MNLTDDQLRAVTTFARGQAAVYAEGNDHPFLVEVYAFKHKSVKGRVRDEDVRAAMDSLAPRHAFDSRVRDDALTVVQHPDFRERFARLMYALLLDAPAGLHGYADVRGLIGQAVRVRSADDEKQIARCLMIEALLGWFEEKGRSYNWFYNATDNLRQQLEAIALKMVDGFENRADVLTQLATAIQTDLAAFQRGYRELCGKASVPYEGCFIVCRSELRCLYRYDVERLAQDKTLCREAVNAIQSAKSDDEMWRALADIVRAASRRIVPEKNAADAAGAALCLVAQIGPQLELSREGQRKLARNVKAVIEAKT